MHLLTEPVYAPDFRGPAPMPNSPTDAAPGSPEKIAVLAERAARNQQLHHPSDAGLFSADFSWELFIATAHTYHGPG